MIVFPQTVHSLISETLNPCPASEDGVKPSFKLSAYKETGERWIIEPNFAAFLEDVHEFI